MNKYYAIIPDNELIILLRYSIHNRKNSEFDLIYADDGRVGGNLYEGYSIDSFLTNFEPEKPITQICLRESNGKTGPSELLSNIRAISPFSQIVYIRESYFNKVGIWPTKNAIASAYIWERVNLEETDYFVWKNKNQLLSYY